MRGAIQTAHGLRPRLGRDPRAGKGREAQGRDPIQRGAAAARLSPQGMLPLTRHPSL